ncbi:MAG: ribosome-associated translation inhibitor RaiA [Clostridia bacterium]|nr:ribosome-associated translation inhibitor RaiA [Clostridia bacterium]
MNVNVIGRKCTPRDSFIERAEKKLAKLDKFFDKDAEARVTATVEKRSQSVEVTVNSGGLIFRAESRADNMNEALDNTVDLLIRQIRKNKTKVEKKLKTDAFAEAVSANAGGDEVVEETEFEVVRRKTIPVKPQSVDESILQMNMLGHRFYMFINAENDRTAVVYAREDGGYGLLESDK